MAMAVVAKMTEDLKNMMSINIELTRKNGNL